MNSVSRSFIFDYLKSIRYYASFQLGFVVIVILLSSLGAFFHFLLDHEISIVESWLHNNQWEILISSKLITLYLMNRWFQIRLYELKSIRTLISELISWPETKAVVVSFFMLISYVSLGEAEFVSQNTGYWYHHFASFFGVFIFFGIEFIVIAYFDDILNQDSHPARFWLILSYTFLFTVAFRISVPDYFKLIPHVVMCFSSLVYLSGKNFKIWSNVLIFLVVFVAPMASLFGMDPVWGDDFSIFRVSRLPNPAFLAVIWVLSFLYYNYRDHVVFAVRRLLK